MGIKPIQRACPGKSASSAGTKISSQIPPSDFAMGDMTRRERNQRIPNPMANTGIRNAPMPQNCSIKSAMTAPTKPIQFRAACEPVSTEALLNDGSSGEYEASARKRRRAETHNRNPISSLSRRLLVGAKIREMDFMARLTPFDTTAEDAKLRQSQTIMPRSGAGDNWLRVSSWFPSKAHVGMTHSSGGALAAGSHLAIVKKRHRIAASLRVFS